MSPAGWALASMWYDKYPGVPPRGSPLETAFVFVTLKRQMAQIMGIRALVQTGLPEDKESSDPAVKAFQAYCDAAMPPVAERETSADAAKQRLLEFVKHPVSIDLRPVWNAKMADANQRVAAMRRSVRKRPAGIS